MSRKKRGFEKEFQSFLNEPLSDDSDGSFSSRRTSRYEHSKGSRRRIRRGMGSDEVLKSDEKNPSGRDVFEVASLNEREDEIGDIPKTDANSTQDIESLAGKIPQMDDSRLTALVFGDENADDEDKKKFFEQMNIEKEEKASPKKGEEIVLDGNSVSKGQLSVDLEDDDKSGKVEPSPNIVKKNEGRSRGSEAVSFNVSSLESTKLPALENSKDEGMEKIDNDDVDVRRSTQSRIADILRSSMKNDSVDVILSEMEKQLPELAEHIRMYPVVSEIRDSFSRERKVMNEDIQLLKDKIEVQEELNQELKGENDTWKRRYSQLLASTANDEKNDQESESLQEVMRENFELKKKMEDWNVNLRKRLRSGEASEDTEVTADELRHIEKEIAEQEMLIQGYQRANERIMKELKETQNALRDERESTFGDFEQTRKERDTLKVQLERTQNEPSNNSALRALRNEIEECKEVAAEKESELKFEIDKLRKEKKIAEGRAAGVDVEKMELEGHAILDVEKKFQKERNDYERRIGELESRLRWYTENQEVFDANEALVAEQGVKIKELEAKIVQMESSGHPSRQGVVGKSKGDRNTERLEKEITRLKNLLKNRDSNSVTALVRAVKESDVENETVQALSEKLRVAEQRLLEKDRESDLALRKLRQDYDRMTQTYEARIKKMGEDVHRGRTVKPRRPQRAGDTEKKTVDSPKRIEELEAELASVREKLMPIIPALETKCVGTNFIDASAAVMSDIEELRRKLEASEMTRKAMEENGRVIIHNAHADAAEKVEKLRTECQRKIDSITNDHETQMEMFKQTFAQLKQEIPNQDQQKDSLIVDEVESDYGVLLRKVDSLESKLKERDVQYTKAVADSQQLSAMQISLLRRKFALILQSKNAEISRFRVELERILHVISNLRESQSKK